MEPVDALTQFSDRRSLTAEMPSSSVPTLRMPFRLKVLVTGGAGYIGGHTVIALLDRHEMPIVLDDLSTGNRAVVPTNVPLAVGDVGDIEFVTQLIREHRIDAIVHFAAKIIVP